MTHQLDEVGVPGGDLVDGFDRRLIICDHTFHWTGYQIVCVFTVQEGNLLVERLFEEGCVGRLHVFQFATGRTDGEDEVEFLKLHHALQDRQERKCQTFLGRGGGECVKLVEGEQQALVTQLLFQQWKELRFKIICVLSEGLPIRAR